MSRMSTPAPQPPPERAEDLYAELLQNTPRAGAADVEELCSRHPGLARELRELHDVRRLLDDLATAPAAAGGETRAPPSLDGFRTLRRIGGGGMGEVWEAYDLRLARRVAIKVLLPSAARSPREAERLRREALAAARLSHPNVVALLSIGDCQGQPYLVQELVGSGRTLRDEIEEQRRAGGLPRGHERVIAQRFAALADALARAHEQGVVHRDVKPQNILLAPDGAPKLADFGLAKTAGEAGLSRTGEFVGTYLYASPEQVSAGRAPVGPASDVFSLGATLYESLTLERPFRGDDVQAIARSILHDDPADPRSRHARLPRDLAVIALRALEKRPEARYASMTALRDDLRRFLAGEPILARPPGAARRLGRRILRHPTAATAIVGAAALFVAILTLLERTQHARDELQQANDRLSRANEDLVLARREAQREADTSTEVVTFLSDLFHSGDPDVAGNSTPTLRDAILQGAERLRAGEVSEPHVRAVLASELGVLLSRLGHWSEALALLQEADALHTSLGQSETRAAAQTRALLAIAHWDRGQTATCRAILEPLGARAREPGLLPQATRLAILGTLGFVVSEDGDATRGEALLREALALVPSLTPEEATEARMQAQIARCALAANFLRQGRLVEARDLIEPLCDEVLPGLAACRTIALEACNVRARVWLQLGRGADALRECEALARAAETALGAEHPRTLNLHTNLASCLIALGRMEEAEDVLLAVASTAEEGSQESLVALYNLGTAWIGLGRAAEAEEVLRALVEQELALHGEGHLRTAMARSNHAIALFRLGRAEEAAREQETALATVPPEVAERSLMEEALALYRGAPR